MEYETYAVEVMIENNKLSSSSSAINYSTVSTGISQQLQKVFMESMDENRDKYPQFDDTFAGLNILSNGMKLSMIMGMTLVSLNVLM